MNWNNCGGVRTTEQSAKQPFAAAEISSTDKTKVRAEWLERCNGSDQAFESMLKAGRQLHPLTRRENYKELQGLAS